MARGTGTGARSVTSASGNDGPVAGSRSPEARRSRTVPDANATTSSPRTSPARASPLGSLKVANFIVGSGP